MTRIHTLPIHVEFGDCDPAGIVWFPNFFRWFDAGSRRFFIACGVPTWKELEKTTGIIGTPLVDTQARFVKPASYGDEIVVETSITEWRGKSFVMRHRILRDGDLLWKQVGGLPCDITNIATRLDCALYAVKMARIRAESIVRTGTALADAAQGGAS